MFQVLTGESWSEAVVRPVLFGWNSGEPFAAFIIGLSFISFFVLTAIVLQNVVVTVLLDAFLATPAGAEEKKESAAELARQLGCDKGCFSNKRARIEEGGIHHDGDGTLRRHRRPSASGPMYFEVKSAKEVQ